jgi:hypothetical protein
MWTNRINKKYLRYNNKFKFTIELYHSIRLIIKLKKIWIKYTNKQIKSITKRTIINFKSIIINHLELKIINLNLNLKIKQWIRN